MKRHQFGGARKAILIWLVACFFALKDSSNHSRPFENDHTISCPMFGKEGMFSGLGVSERNLDFFWSEFLEWFFVIPVSSKHLRRTVKCCLVSSKMHMIVVWGMWNTILNFAGSVLFYDTGILLLSPKYCRFTAISSQNSGKLELQNPTQALLLSACTFLLCWQ